MQKFGTPSGVYHINLGVPWSARQDVVGSAPGQARLVEIEAGCLRGVALCCLRCVFDRQVRLT